MHVFLKRCPGLGRGVGNCNPAGGVKGPKVDNDPGRRRHKPEG